MPHLETPRFQMRRWVTVASGLTLSKSRFLLVLRSKIEVEVFNIKRAFGYKLCMYVCIGKCLHFVNWAGLISTTVDILFAMDIPCDANKGLILISMMS